MDKQKTGGLVDQTAAAIFALAAAGALVLFLVGCAGWGKTSCQVVDAASQACTVIKFMGDDGRVHEVPLTPAEAKELGRSLEAKKAAEKK